MLRGSADLSGPKKHGSGSPVPRRLVQVPGLRGVRVGLRAAGVGAPEPKAGGAPIPRQARAARLRAALEDVWKLFTNWILRIFLRRLLRDSCAPADARPSAQIRARECAPSVPLSTVANGPPPFGPAVGWLGEAKQFDQRLPSDQHADSEPAEGRSCLVITSLY
jgi:hypothetical protein